MIGIQNGFDFEAALGMSATDEIDDSFEVEQRFATPVQTDEREKAVFDLVPLTGPRRIVAHDNFQFRLVAELLQVVFPGPRRTYLMASSNI